jgi:transposase
MSPAFLAAVGESFPQAEVTVDWFHVVQLFTRAVDQVRKAEAKQTKLPKALRWAVLKAADRSLTDKQAQDLFTATAWRIKEKLRWIRKAESVQAARWRITAFIRHARDGLADEAILEPVRKALETFEKHLEARGYRNTATFITMIYLIAAPIQNLLNSI